MLHCPVCQSFQIFVVVSPSPSAWCDQCGARWIQEGSEQRAIMREPLAYGRDLSTIHQEGPFSGAHVLSEPALMGLGS